MAWFVDAQRVLFDRSAQAIYAYLDDVHKACNEKFATLLGYQSPEEWAGVRGSFPALFVARRSQEALVSTYQNAMENLIASSIEIEWKQKDGGTVTTNVVLVPIIFQGHLFALHFVSS